jgi:hypothetical protein
MATRSRVLAWRILALAVALLPATATAQQVLIDRGVRAGNLWCFPSSADESQYYYIPMSARLVEEEGRPAFSFVRYVTNALGEGGGSEGITKAGGGGILSFRSVMETPPDEIQAAESALQALAGDDQTLLRGPIIFKEGRYAVVSSILNGGERERHLLASGNAPVLEGNQLAFSFEVDADRATLLMRSFEMATPDVSVAFEMVFEGLSEAYDADVIVRWDDVQKHEAFSGGASVGYGPFEIGGKMQSAFDELRQSKAIEINTRGSDEKMDAILDRTLSKFVDIMFDKVEPEQAGQQPQQQADGGLGGMMDQAVGFLEGLTNPENVKDYYKAGYPTVSLSVGYKLKEQRRSGTSRLNLSSRTTIQRHSSIAFNIGDLYQRFKDNESFFRTVNLDDPAFVQREIHVGVDGTILPEFDQLLNSVTVTLRKQHQNGAETLREILVNRRTFDQPFDAFRMIYGWNGDSNRAAWLEYDYRTSWSFKSGGNYETPWSRDTASMIDLYAPYERRTVQILGNSEKLTQAGVRAVYVEIAYDFLGQRKTDEITIETKDADKDHEIQITLPRDQLDYAYTVTWLRRDGTPLMAEGRDDTGVLFIDDLPGVDGAASH